MKNKILIIVLAIFFNGSAEALFEPEQLSRFSPPQQGTANPVNSGGKGDPTDGEIGIIGTLAGVYNKGREAVKAVYDEIQYWKGIAATYDRLKNWYDDQRNKFQNIRRTAARLTHNPGEVFRNSRQRNDGDWFDNFLNTIETPLNFAHHYTSAAASTVNQMDEFAYGGIRNLDRIFMRTERYFNALHESKIHGVFMPNPQEVFYKFDEMIFLSPKLSEQRKRAIIDERNFIQLSGLNDEYFRIEQETRVEFLERYMENNRRLFEDAGVSEFPQTRIIQTLKGLTASAVDNSAMYLDWAESSMESLSKNMDIIHERIEAGNFDNLMDLQLLAAKLELEMINANNKRIMHEMEALKVHHAMLGYEIWKHGRTKAFAENAIADVLTLRNIALDNLEDMRKRRREGQR